MIQNYWHEFSKGTPAEHAQLHFRLRKQKYSVLLASAKSAVKRRNPLPLFAAATVQKYCRVRNSSLNRWNWLLKKNKLLWMTAVLFFMLGCSVFAAPATPDSALFATLQASTPEGYSSPVAADATNTAPFSVPSRRSLHRRPILQILTRLQLRFPRPSDQPAGHIVFTCQVFKVTAMNQICIMNADGTGYRRLTTEDNLQHFYPSLSPDGQSVVYAGFGRRTSMRSTRSILPMKLWIA